MTGPTPDWVMLRGLTREARHWGDFPRRMELALGAKVLCLDLPGNGRRNHMRSPATVEAMADWCHMEIVGAGVPRPCAILGMSLGAMVAVAWAERHPQDVERAVLINTSLRPFSAFYQRLLPRNYFRVLGLLALPASERRIEAAIFRMTSRGAADTVIGQWTVWRTENPVSRRNALVQLFAASTYRAPTARPVERVLLLASECDGLVASACSRRLAKQWQIPLQIHPDAGHDLPLDDPDWVVQQVKRWLGVSI
ncbi:MAG: alpha/beta hydrolase [Rhodocyclales bacterium]|nr:alpha/beta hydrolase [Rhodocyclales bacterium]